MNKCKCGKPAAENRRVCAECLYQQQAAYRQRKAADIADYQRQYRKDNAERLRKYNREYMRRKRAGRRPADILARRPWHEQEAMRL